LPLIASLIACRWDLADRRALEGLLERRMERLVGGRGGAAGVSEIEIEIEIEIGGRDGAAGASEPPRESKCI
jgi:hypothetical protein